METKRIIKEMKELGWPVEDILTGKLSVKNIIPRPFQWPLQYRFKPSCCFGSTAAGWESGYKAVEEWLNMPREGIISKRKFWELIEEGKLKDGLWDFYFTLKGYEGIALGIKYPMKDIYFDRDKRFIALLPKIEDETTTTEEDKGKIIDLLSDVRPEHGHNWADWTEYIYIKDKTYIKKFYRASYWYQTTIPAKRTVTAFLWNEGKPEFHWWKE